LGNNSVVKRDDEEKVPSPPAVDIAVSGLKCETTDDLII